MVQNAQKETPVKPANKEFASEAVDALYPAEEINRVKKAAHKIYTEHNGGRGAFGEENCIGGCPGQAGGTASGTYTIPTSGDIPTKVVITIGGSGAGNRCGEGANGASVAGQSGAAWILGVQ